MRTQALWIPLALLLFSPAALAQQVAISIDESTAQGLGLDASDVESSMSGQISGDLNLVDQQAYLQSMANAAALASRGMGVDYASNVKRLIFGASLGSAVHSSSLSLGRGDDELPDGGFSSQLSLMAGVNLGFGDDDAALSRVRLFASGMAFTYAGDSFDASLYNLGGHVQVQLLKPRETAVVEWGGLAVTSGYQSAGYSLGLSSGLPVTVDEEGVSLTWDATGEYDIRAATTSVPLELSTNLRVLMVTVYAGGGADFITSGSATSAASLGGEITASAVGEQASLGTAVVSLSDEGYADELVPRVFAGAQLNVLMFKAYTHFNVGLNGSAGLNLGLRVAL